MALAFFKGSAFAADDQLITRVLLDEMQDVVAKKARRETLKSIIGAIRYPMKGWNCPVTSQNIQVGLATRLQAVKRHVWRQVSPRAPTALMRAWNGFERQLRSKLGEGSLSLSEIDTEDIAGAAALKPPVFHENIGRKARFLTVLADQMRQDKLLLHAPSSGRSQLSGNLYRRYPKLMYTVQETDLVFDTWFQRQGRNHAMIDGMVRYGKEILEAIRILIHQFPTVELNYRYMELADSFFCLDDCGYWEKSSPSVKTGDFEESNLGKGNFCFHGTDKVTIKTIKKPPKTWLEILHHHFTTWCMNMDTMPKFKKQMTYDVGTKTYRMYEMPFRRSDLTWSTTERKRYYPPYVERMKLIKALGDLFFKVPRKSPNLLLWGASHCGKSGLVTWIFALFPAEDIGFINDGNFSLSSFTADKKIAVIEEPKLIPRDALLRFTEGGDTAIVEGKRINAERVKLDFGKVWTRQKPFKYADDDSDAVKNRFYDVYFAVPLKHADRHADEKIRAEAERILYYILSSRKRWMDQAEASGMSFDAWAEALPKWNPDVAGSLFK